MAEYRGSWKELTSAELNTMDELMEAKRAADAVFVGVAGFSR
eukprot:CAMPEP_0173399044 /NCGR_PEP_ID=MMETSP1356-20130122/43804_1 /TAXON_ID=77927 ORGANISM="Hemiselmis virescens, Strain PCC157" /NCGR_SAMPLE_ID=MMETSP1356 /ASSEMBLY_ACC=CAM_ASM_000847 /LENGTH=41 /DNA_ID= /DNA_START= /DNA_END= /DNA_ORIENTATION=